MATAFGRTEKEAGDNLVLVVQKYLNMYPDKTSDVLNVGFKKIDL